MTNKTLSKLYKEVEELRIFIIKRGTLRGLKKEEWINKPEVLSLIKKHIDEKD